MTAPSSGAPVVIVGGGHNGLVAGCYLAKAGRRVLVLEAGDKFGGGSRTDETIPGYRFNTHSAAHNIINMSAPPSCAEPAPTRASSAHRSASGPA